MATKKALPVTIVEVFKADTTNLLVEKDDLSDWHLAHGASSPETGTLKNDSCVGSQTVRELRMQSFAPGDTLLVHDIW